MDVTERLNLEAQLLHSQKMESVGQLAGGIAHDFNNLLTVINGHTGLLLAMDNLAPKVADPIREIANAARRAADLTRQLLTFSRKNVLQPQIVDMNEVVGNWRVRSAARRAAWQSRGWDRRPWGRGCPWPATGRCGR